MRAGRLIGWNPGDLIQSYMLQRWRQSESGSFRYSVIGAAIPDKYHNWLAAEGKSGLSLDTLIHEGHVKVPEREKAPLVIIDRLDHERIRHTKLHGFDFLAEKLRESVIGLVAMTPTQSANLLKATSDHAARWSQEGVKYTPRNAPLSAVIGRAEREG